MQRRDVLTALSVMALPVLAGCSDVEFNGDEASITEPLDLVEHDVSTESGTPYDTATVSGELKNTGSTWLAFVSIRGVVHNSDGETLTRGDLRTMRLEPDGTWEFELDLSVDDSSEIETYDLEVVEILEAAPDEILDDQEAGENVEMYDGLQTTDHDISHGQMEFRLQAGVESVTRSGLVLEGDETIEAYPDILDDHDDVLEPVGGDDAFQGVASIEGTVENTHDSQINEIEVRARVYNEAGERIHQGTVSTASLGTGASWDFELTIEDDLRAVASYDIAVLTAEN